jgi:hypothetical protein
MTQPNPPFQQPAPQPALASTDSPLEGVSAEEWQALGDPGKAALRRERQARDDLQRQLAEARKPAPQPVPVPAPAPAPAPAPPAPQPQPQPTPSGSDTPVFSDLIAQAVSQAVQQAVAPLQQRFAQDDQARAQQAFDAALGERAGQVLADVRDAALLDRSALVDANGQPDAARINAVLQQLVTDRPHLARRTSVGQPLAAPSGALPALASAPSGQGFGAPAALSIEDKRKHVRGLMGGPAQPTPTP